MEQEQFYVKCIKPIFDTLFFKGFVYICHAKSIGEKKVIYTFYKEIKVGQLKVIGEFSSFSRGHFKKISEDEYLENVLYFKPIDLERDKDGIEINFTFLDLHEMKFVYNIIFNHYDHLNVCYEFIKRLAPIIDKMNNQNRFDL